MAIDGIKVQPEQQNFLDSHFSIAPQWDSFRSNLKDKSFANAVITDTRSDDKLKIFAKAINMRDQVKGKTVKAPSDTSGSYDVKYHPSEGRFSCTCPDWTYKRSVGGGDCKHIARIKPNTKNMLMKKIATMPPASALFSVGRTINREHKDKTTTEKIKTENKAYEAAYHRPGFIHQWLKHASVSADVNELAKKMAQAARNLLII